MPITTISPHAALLQHCRFRRVPRRIPPEVGLEFRSRRFEVCPRSAEKKDREPINLVAANLEQKIVVNSHCPFSVCYDTVLPQVFILTAFTDDKV